MIKIIFSLYYAHLDKKELLEFNRPDTVGDCLYSID